MTAEIDGGEVGEKAVEGKNKKRLEEDVKMEFERSKACFEQNHQQLRHLNEQLNRVPITSMTLTGGLWYVAVTSAQIAAPAKFVILFFSCIANLFLILIAIRTRDVMEAYIECLREFNPTHPIKGTPKIPKFVSGSYSMITMYCILILSASLISCWGSLFLAWPWYDQYCPCWGILAYVFIYVLAFLLLRIKLTSSH